MLHLYVGGMMRSIKGAITWDVIAYAVLAMVAAVVLIIIFTGASQRSTQTVTQCKGLLDFGEFTGMCKLSCETGETEVATFGGGCTRDQVCCLVERAEGTT